MKQDVSTIIEMISLEDPRYHEDAYEFLLEGLHFTQRKYKRSKHVSALHAVLATCCKAPGLYGKN